jgi:hypothetical protein
MTCEAETEFMAPWQNLEKWLLALSTSTCPSVSLAACNKSAPGGRIFINFDIRLILENMSRKLNFSNIWQE